MELLLSLFLTAVPAAPAPSPAAPRELRGRVLSEGRPVAGATVVALPVESVLEQARREARFADAARELARATAGRDGSFVLRWPAGVEELRLQVSAAGHVPALLNDVYDTAGSAGFVDAHLARSASLAGTVLDASGKPVAGATLTLRPSDQEMTSRPLPVSGTSGPDGRFRFDGASERGNRLRVEAPGQAVVELAGLRAGALRQAIRLQPGRSLDGVVRRADDQPAAGAVVRLEGPVTLRWVEASATGAFRLEGLPSTPGGRLVAEAGDAGRAQSAVPPAGPVRLVLAPAATLRGRVVDARSGSPVAGARVVAGSQTGESTGRSGADGRYEIRGLAPGSHALGADQPRYVRWQLDRLDLPAGAVVTRDIPLVPAATLSGRVVDEDGLPVADAQGYVRRGDTGPLAFWNLRSEALPAFRTGPDGRFEAARLPAGSNLNLSVTHDDYESRTIGGLDLEPGRPRPPLQVVLRRGLGLVGVVKDVRGQPVAEAELRLARSLEFAGGRGGRAVQFSFIGAPGGRSEVRSGPDGRFEFRGLAAGDYSLHVRKSGHAAQRVDPLRVSEGPAQPLEVTLALGVTISGFVRDKSGQGLEGRRVGARVRGARGPLATTFSDEPSGSDGAFLVEGLTAGQAYDVFLQDLAGPGPRGTPITAPAEGVELLASSPGRVEGLALDAESGRPLADFAVSYEVRDRGGRTIVRGGPDGSSLTPGEKVEFHDEEGRFALENVPAGTWDVEVAAHGYEPGRAGAVVVAEGGSAAGVEVRLRRGATLTGRVLEAGSGRPVADALVEAAPQGGDERLPRFGDEGQAGVRTGLDGRFELPGLTPGSYTVSARHNDYAEASESVTVRGLTAAVELRLGQGSRLAGAVVSAGRPVGGATITLGLAGEGFGGFGPGGQEAQSDEAGRYRFERLTPGRYTLVATLRGQSSSPVEAVVQGSQSRDDLVLELTGGAAIHGQVKGLPDSERAGVQVSARGPEQYFASARTAADGAFELVGAPVGPISLNARVGDFTTGSRSASGQAVVGEGQTDVTAEIVFEPGFEIQGTFTRAGVPVPEAHVWAFPRGGGGGRGASATTNASGEFALAGLAAGRYQVHASTPGQTAAGASASREIELTGDTTLDLAAALGRLSGSVLEAETRRPLNGAVVELSGDGPRFGRATTDSAGLFEIEDLEPGPATLTARKPGYETAVRPIDVQESGSETTLELRRGEGIGLVARDGVYGTPLRELFVRVLDPAGTNLFTGGVSLDSEGRGEVPGLAPGSYELRIDAGSYAPVMLRGVAVPTPALAVVLTAGGTLEVTSGPETLGRPGSRARLLAADGLPYFLNIFSSEGWLPLGQPLRQFENVAPGTYTLAVDGGVTRLVEVREGAISQIALP